MEFIDSHTHLYLPEFDEDRFSVVEKAIDAGITKMLLPNIDKSSIGPMLELCKAFPGHCYPMMGLHPTSVKADFKDHLDAVETALQLHRFVAIGEVGIDLYWDKTFFAQQREALVFQIGLARKYSLPLVIHSRDSFTEILEIMHSQYTGTPYRGVFHSFSGSLEQAREITALGFNLGINGVVTFKNSNLKETIQGVPLEQILLETDAPYLTPVPKRGTRNESAYILHIANKIAEIKNIPLEEVARVTTQTTNALFNLS